MSEIKRVTGLIRLANLLPALKETFWRFGPSCIGVLTTTLVGLLMVHDPIYKGLVYKGLVDTDWLERVLATMMIATVALTSVKLAGESANWSKAKYAAGVMMVLALIYLFIWQLLNQAFTVTYFIFALAALLSLMFAPYVQRQSDSDSVWYFNYQMGVGVFFAAFSALILGIGLLLIVASLGYLFEFKVPEKLFLDIWVVCWAGYFPLYILANIPKTFNFEQQHCEFPKGVKFIVNFILVPLMFAYMAILYAYFVKILLQGQLPRGNLGWMIICFGTIGITTKLLAYPIRHSGTKLLTWFYQYYYHALMMPIILLFIAIGVRIEQFGLTEARYIVVMLGVWFSSVAIFAILKKDRFEIKMVPISLFLLALTASFGPWGMVEMSLNSQVKRFKSQLIEHKLLVDGQAVEAQEHIAFEQLKALSSMADYLAKTEQSLARIRPWFDTLLTQSHIETLKPQRWQGGKVVLNLLGLEYMSGWKYENQMSDYFIFDNPNDRSGGLIRVTGFDYVWHGDDYYTANPTTLTIALNDQPKQTRLQIKDPLSLFEVTLVSDTNQTLAHFGFDMIKLVQKLKAANADGIVDASDDFILEQSDKNQQITVRLLIKNIKGQVTTSGNIQLEHVSYMLMLKMKAPIE